MEKLADNLLPKTLHPQELKKVTHPTPFIITDLDRAGKNFQRLSRLMPNVKIHYAVKCNPHEQILRKLKIHGSSFEIASIGELDRLTKIGVPASDVIFSNPVKVPEQVRLAYDRGVRVFAIDSIEEIDKLVSFAPKAKVLIRISVSNQGSAINLAMKFGCEMKHAAEIMIHAKQQGLIPYGITFHVGSQAEDLGVWDEAFACTQFVLENLQKQGIKVSVINIGGGFPVYYGKEVPKIETIAARIQSNIDNLPYKVNIWCEPGRYLVADTSVIAVTIISTVKRGSASWLYLDAGRFQSFIEMFESDSIQYPVFSAESGVNSELEKYTLTGPTCDSYDTIAHDVWLPKNLSIGDKLYFGMTGAYTTVYGSSFNDFPVPKQIFTD